jgi:pimeloyl-ACP methyl ester carboxylesterase
LPDWSLFDDEELVDLDDERREALRARSVPEPRGVAYDRFVLTDDRRYDVPATIICCALPSARLREWVAEGSPWVAELAAMQDVEYVDLPTGHWPQFTKPKELAQAILAAVDR